MNEYLSKIIDRLNNANIKKIISIDNDWEITKNITVDLETDLKNFIDEKEVNVSSDVDTVINNEAEIFTIKDLLENQNPELSEIQEEVRGMIFKEGELQPALKVLDEILEYISKNSNIEIEKKVDMKLEYDKYENCMFILDKNMGQGNADVIVDSILNINRSGETKNNLILIYSSEIISDYGSNVSKINYLKGKQVNEKQRLYLIYSMWAIAKKTTTEELLPEMHSVLLKSFYGNTLYDVIKCKQNIEENVYEKLIEIDTTELSDTIKDSFIEGDSIVQAIDRIYESIKGMIETEEILKNQSYINSLQDLISFEREIIDEKIKDDIDSYKKFRKERKKEKLKLCLKNSSQHAIVDYRVNSLYHDISTGDIFKIRTSDQGEPIYGILVTQSCSCVIRIPKDNMDEIGRTAQQMQLLLLTAETIKDDYSNNEIDKIKDDAIWPINIGSKMVIMNPTNKIISIPSHILDLCSLNKQGYANIDFDQEIIRKSKPYHSAKYFINFKNEFFGDGFRKEGQDISNIYEDLFKSLHNIPEVACAARNQCQENENIRKKIFNKSISLKYRIKFENNQFDLKRIGRLESKRTLLLIQDYIYQLSKPGTQAIPNH